MAKLFKSSIPNIFMILASGTKAEFANGIFFTTDEDDIAYLTKEVKRGHPHIYIDANEPEIDTDAVTPYEQLRKKIRQELMAEMQAAGDVSNQRGNYDVGTDNNAGIDAGVVTTTKANPSIGGASLTSKPAAPAQSATIGGLAAAALAKLQAGKQTDTPPVPAESTAEEPTSTPVASEEMPAVQ